MDQDKKEMSRDDTPILAGDPKYQSINGPSSSGSNVSSTTFRQRIGEPQATSTPYPPDEKIPVRPVPEITPLEAGYMVRCALERAAIRETISEGRKAKASAHEVTAAIHAKKQQLDEAMRGAEGRFQSVFEKLNAVRQASVPMKRR